MSAPPALELDRLLELLDRLEEKGGGLADLLRSLRELQDLPAILDVLEKCQSDLARMLEAGASPAPPARKEGSRPAGGGGA